MFLLNNKRNLFFRNLFQGSRNIINCTIISRQKVFGNCSHRTFFCPPLKPIAESAKRILVIGMQNPAHNPGIFPKEGGGHFAKIETRMKIILEDQPNPVFNDPFGREIVNKARVDLDHIKYLIEHYGFRFDKNFSKG